MTKEPFDDLRVRQAMNMALDHETINATYYKGYGNWEPQGHLSSDMTGYTTPFAEWPEEVKKYYTYDPEGAEALLDAAGLERGADGIRFKTVLNSAIEKDTSYQELVAGYWREIGIQVEIRTVENPERTAMQASGDFEGFWASGMARRMDPLSVYSFLYSKPAVWKPGGASLTRFMTPCMKPPKPPRPAVRSRSGCLERWACAITEMHWMIWGTESPQFNANWPWVKGYNGELPLGIADFNYPHVYLWIDQDLKKAMGY